MFKIKTEEKLKDHVSRRKPEKVFMEVEDVEEFWESLKALRLNEKYSTAKLVPVRHLDWGKECFLHDPSGILWHFGAFTLK